MKKKELINELNLDIKIHAVWVVVLATFLLMLYIFQIKAVGLLVLLGVTSGIFSLIQIASNFLSIRGLKSLDNE
jgi:Na+/H+ antiporter NhaC